MSKLPQMTFEILNSEILILDIAKTLVCLPLIFVIFWLLKTRQVLLDSKKLWIAFLWHDRAIILNFRSFVMFCWCPETVWMPLCPKSTKAWIDFLWQTWMMQHKIQKHGLLSCGKASHPHRFALHLSCPACLKTCLKASLSRRSTLW
jgi:hypothetical protein